MKPNKRILLFFSLFLIFLNGCRTEELTLKIVETTDVHGSLLDWDFIENTQAENSLSRVYSYVSELRTDKSYELILLDDGDILQGQPSVYYYNFIATNEKHIVPQVMNFVDYDAGTVGNHDIETGHPVYDKLADEFNFPWLAANAVDTSTGEPYFEPYTVIRKKGITIAIFGMITPGIPGWLPEHIWEGIEFEDMIETAEKWIPIIQEKEDPDLIVGLFHSGTDYTYGNQSADTFQNENASLLVAERVPGFDIVFCGHDHTIYNDFVTNTQGNPVLVLDANNRARNAAVATITFTLDKESGEYNKTISGEIIDTTLYDPNPEFESRFASVVEEVKEFFSREIGTFTKTISSRPAIFGDSAFMGLIHHIQLEISGADISFAAPLLMDTTIDQGPVTVSDMFKLYQYENLLYTMRLNGQEIKDYLEYSYGNWTHTMSGPDDYMLNYSLDENGERIWSERYENYELSTRYYNYDSAAGIIYAVDLSKEAGGRVNIISLSDGSEFDYSADYEVAINSYRGNGGGYLLTEGAGIPEDELADRILDSTIKDLRYYMIEWIENNGEGTPEAYGNWQVIPADWWTNAMLREYEELFGEKPTGYSRVNSNCRGLTSRLPSFLSSPESQRTFYGR